MFTLASLLAAASGSILALDASRALQGVGAALVLGNSLAILADAYEGKERAMAIAAFSSVLQVAVVAAPLLGGLLITLSWRWMFLVNLPVGVIALVAALVRLPHDEPVPRDQRIDWLGTVLLVVALVLVNLGLLRGEDQGWVSTTTLLQLGSGAVVLAAFLLVERKAAAPVIDVGLFRIPAFAAISVLALLSRVITIGGTVCLVFHIQLTLELSALQSGLVLVPVVAAQTVFGLAAGKVPAGRLIALGYAVKAVGAGLIAAVIGLHGSLGWLLGVMALWGAGGGIAGAPMMSVAVGSVPKERTGMASGRR